MRIEHHGILFGILASFCMAAMSILVKLSAAIPNETIVFFRFLFGFCLLYLFGKKKELCFSFKKSFKHLIRTCGGLGGMYTQFYALKNLPLATSVTLSNTMPLFMPLVVLLGYRLVVSRRRFIGALIGFMGVIAILGPKEGFSEWAAFVGLSSGLFSAVALFSVRHISKTETPMTILWYYFIIGALISFFPMVYSWQPVQGKTLLYLVAIAVPGFFYQYFITLAFKNAPASKASLPSYLVVFLGGIADWLIWGTVPTLWILLGIALIVLGGLIAIFDQTPPRPLKIPRIDR